MLRFFTTLLFLGVFIFFYIVASWWVITTTYDLTDFLRPEQFRDSAVYNSMKQQGGYLMGREILPYVLGIYSVFYVTFVFSVFKVMPLKK